MARTTMAAAFVLATLALVAAPARAGTANRAWVSGRGVDQPGCGAPTAPCRSLQYVHDNIIAAGGEVDILDPAGYGAITITKAISIINDGVGTAGLQQSVFGLNAVTISAGPSDVVTLRGLNLDGLGVGSNGVKFTSGSRLVVTNCSIRHFTTNAIAILPTGSMTFRISNVAMNDNNNTGFQLVYTGASGAIVVVGEMDRAEINNNTNGLEVFDNDASSLLSMTIADSVISNNGGDGVYFGQLPQANTLIINTNASYNGTSGFHIDGGYARITRSAAYGNGDGVKITLGGTAETYGDNEFVGNSVNVAGSFVPLTGQR